MDHKRRALITEPGTHLLLPTSIFDVQQNFTAFIEWSGLTPEQLVISPLSALPLPAYSAIPEGRRRWPGVRPEAMWHPLMWLPARLTIPRIIQTEGTNTTWLETPDEWTVRTLLEMTDTVPVQIDNAWWVLLYDFAGSNFVRPAGPGDKHLVPMYDPATGTWLDILSLVGIDVDDAIGLARVEAWLDGEDDPALDSIELERLLRVPGRDADWALHRTHRRLQDTDEGGTTASYVEDLRQASTAVVCTELAELAGDLATKTPEAVPVEDIATRVITLAAMAREMTSLPAEEQEDFAAAMDELTVAVADTTSPVEVRRVAAQLATVLGAVRSATVAGIDRLDLRFQVESTEVIEQITRIQPGAFAGV